MHAGSTDAVVNQHFGCAMDGWAYTRNVAFKVCVIVCKVLRHFKAAALFVGGSQLSLHCTANIQNGHILQSATV